MPLTKPTKRLGNVGLVGVIYQRIEAKQEQRFDPQRPIKTLEIPQI